MDNDKIIEKITELATKLEGHTSDIHNLYKKCEDLSADANNNNINVQRILVMIENMNSKIDGMNAKLTELYDKPNKNWAQLINVGISAVVSGLIAFVLVKLGLK